MSIMEIIPDDYIYDEQIHYNTYLFIIQSTSIFNIAFALSKMNVPAYH